MQRVVNAHPVHWEETLLSQLAIAKHLLTEITHLNVEREIVDGLVEFGYHLAEQLIGRIVTLGIDAFTKHAAVDEDKGWKPHWPYMLDCQQVA